MIALPVSAPVAASPAALQLIGVHKSWRAGIDGCCAAVRALRDVSLTVAPGEIVGITGGAGAGKSTLLLCAAGLALPDSGSVRWFGRPRFARDRAPIDRVAYVAARMGAAQSRTVLDVLRHHAACMDVPASRRSVEARDACVRAGLRARSHASVAALSVGERRQLAVARSVVGAPRLVLLDDPLAGLDAPARRTMRATLQAIAEDGAALVVAEREAGTLRGLVHRIVSLRDGRLAAGARAARRRRSRPGGGPTPLTLVAARP